MFIFTRSYVAFSLPLEVMTLHPQCESVETSEGVPLFVTGVSQIKVMNKTDGDFSYTDKAAEQFLGKTKKEIANIVLQTLEGHLRAILGKLHFRIPHLACSF